MANWIISDELDARLRERLGVDNPAAFAERLIADHLDEEDDPAYAAEVDRKIKLSMQEFKAGKFIDAREGMCQIAAEHGIKLDR